MHRAIIISLPFDWYEGSSERGMSRVLKKEVAVAWLEMITTFWG